MSFFNDLAVRLYRMRNGGRHKDSRLLLTTVGRASGKQRTVVVMFTPVGGALVLVTSNAGSDRAPGWLMNLRAQSTVEVRLGSETFAARASVVPDDERPAVWEAVVARHPGYAEMQSRTARRFALVRLVRA